jgi:hypothetical protein
MPKFIVVKKIEKEGKPERLQTSSRPRRQLDQETALREATRLANKERKPFVIFQEMATILPSN